MAHGSEAVLRHRFIFCALVLLGVHHASAVEEQTKNQQQSLSSSSDGAKPATDGGLLEQKMFSGRGISEEELKVLAAHRQKKQIPVTSLAGKEARKLGAAALLKVDRKEAPKRELKLVRREASADLTASQKQGEGADAASWDSATARAELASLLTKRIHAMNEFVADMPGKKDAICARFERGLAVLQDVGRAADLGMLRSLIAAIGLEPQPNRSETIAMYGSDHVHAISWADADVATGKDRTLRVGVDAAPAALSCLMMKMQLWNASTILELGTGSGWVSSLLAAQLSLSQHGAEDDKPVTLFTLDMPDRRLDCVRRMHESFGIRFQTENARVTDVHMLSAVKDVPVKVDVCLTDAALSTAIADPQLRHRCKRLVARSAIGHRPGAFLEGSGGGKSAEHCDDVHDDSRNTNVPLGKAGYSIVQFA